MTNDVKKLVLAANMSFYHALEAKDLAAMDEVWMQSSEARCIHPTGKVFTGWSEVRQCWQSLFDSLPSLKFSLQHVHVILNGEIAVITLKENVSVNGRGITQSLWLSATNVFVFADGAWKMAVHHASPFASEATRDMSFLYN